LEEEEDVSRGDLLDFMTPRDISRLRYEQHHEWMEEIIESPYPTLSIIPSDLGFGRKGQLEELTKDFFDAPVAATREQSTGPPPRVGKMASGQADDFIKRASDKLVTMQAELEEMRKKHTRRMEKLRRSTTLTTAEKKLRTVSNVPERQSISKDTINGTTESAAPDAIDEIMGTVESDMGQKLTKTTTVTLISKGGLEERKQISPAPVEPSPPVVPRPQSAVNPAIAANAQVQQPVQPQPPASIAQEQKPGQEELPASVDGTQTPNQPAPAAAEGENLPSATQPSQPVVEEQPPQPEANLDGEDLPQLDSTGTDVNMEGMDGHVDGAEEWVMISEDGDRNDDIPGIQTEGEQDQVQPTAEEPAEDASSRATDLQQPPQAQLNQDAQLNTPDFDMGGDFDNVEVDTAGDALASYGNDEDLNLENMEGSAFGDAFHTEDEEIS
jgi:hypothetical protein